MAPSGTPAPFLLLVGLTLTAGVFGCVGPGLLTDGTSISVGTHSSGALRNGCSLPPTGEGYVVPTIWRDRQRSYGTNELVELLVRIARKVQRSRNGSLLGIADLSPRAGGSTPEHRSHYSGRDVDFIYYATDLQGQPVTPRAMILYDDEGMSVSPASQPVSPGGQGPTTAPRPREGGSPAQAQLEGEIEPQTVQTPPRRLDVARNWELVKSLVTDPQVPVQWIFVGRPITRLLLQHARKKKEPAYIIERAEAVLHQPSDAQTHMDHGHIRIFCSLADRGQGCIDRGPPRWLKKELKYVDAPLPRPTLPRTLAHLLFGPRRLGGL